MPPRKSSILLTEIRQRLDAGEWRPGDMLPDERSLAAGFGVARNTVRKILAELESDGLIERHVGRGTIVSQRPDMQFAGILDNFLDASPIDILNLRIFIEPFTAEAAARHASASELEAILDAGAKAAEATEIARYEFWDNEFHKRIYQAGHNAFLADFFDLLAILRYQLPMMELRRRAFTEERRAEYSREHAEIATALTNWDGKTAARAMRDHLLSRRRNYFGQ